MKSTHILFCLLFILFFSCGNESEDQQDSFTIISVDPSANDELSIDDIASEVEAVKLEETDASLIAHITKVERTSDFIFVFDSRGQKVLQFNNEGKFLKTIGKKGGGPEEVEMPTTFVLDKDKSHVYIGGMRKVVVYDFEGNFVRYFNGFNIPNYMYFDRGTLEIFRTETKNLEEGGSMKFPTRYRLEASTGKVLDSLELTKVSLENQMMFVVMDANYYSESTRNMYFYLPVPFPEPFVRDTLYEVKGTNLIPSVKMDFGKAAISESGNKVVNIRGVFRSDRYLLARYSFERKSKWLVHDFKETKTYNVVDGLYGSEYSDGEPLLSLYPLLGEANTYYFSAKKLEEGMTEEPNPTLYFVKLKN